MPALPQVQPKVDFKELLNDVGFCRIDAGYSPAMIEKWNELLDELFALQTNEKRSYVLPTELFKLGILQEVLNDEIKGLLGQIIPNAIFYHCHAYEIGAHQQRSHLYPKTNGWHRDEECIPAYNPSEPTEISMFIYLTDVALENGPFEIRTGSPFKPVLTGEPTIQVLGSKGTTFLFNRALYHRACPNLSPIRRRVLKFSFQPLTLRNKQICLPEFQDCQNLVQGHPFFEFLFGQHYGQTSATNQILQIQDRDCQPIYLPSEPNAQLSVQFLSLVKMNIRGQFTKYTKWLKEMIHNQMCL